MRKRIGVICILLGALCILGSVGFVIYNWWEDKKAEEITQSLLEDVKSIINEKTTGLDETQMATIKVNGYDSIGILSIPVLDLELPVLTDWSYAKLKKAPCHYYGSYYEKDFVIAAHNYKAYFGRLSELQTGDIVFFTDVNGAVYYYEVVLLETLPKNATKEMITSGFDLSLYTCTLDRAGRVTVRCNAIEDREGKSFE
jgi:sortase A